MVMFKVNFVFDIETTAQFSTFERYFASNLLTHLFIDFSILQRLSP